MALTLECVCSDNEDVAGCLLTELWFEGNSKYTSRFGIEAASSITLHDAGGSIVGHDGTDFEWSDALNLSLADNWNDLFVRATIDSSASQEAVPGGGAFFEYHWWIRAVYECAQTGGDPITYEVRLYEQAGTDGYCWLVVDVTLRSYIHVGGSGSSSVLYSSGPLAECNGSTSDGGVFDPLPTLSIDYENSAPGSVCLCASGGVEPYFYSVTGGLPANLVLNKLTGCITGKLVDRGSSRDVSFVVSDGNRDTANVTCNFMMRCGGVRHPLNRMH